MKKVTVLLCVLLSLLCKVTFAEGMKPVPRLFDDFKNSFLEILMNKHLEYIHLLAIG